MKTNREHLTTFSLRLPTKTCNMLDKIAEEEGFKTRSGLINKFLNDLVRDYSMKEKR